MVPQMAIELASVRKQFQTKTRINQLEDDMDWLLEVAHNVPLDYMFEDDPSTNINPNAWERYKKSSMGLWLLITPIRDLFISGTPKLRFTQKITPFALRLRSPKTVLLRMRQSQRLQWLQFFRM